MLTVLSYILAIVVAIALILCIASGLSNVCSWIEERPAQSRRLGRQATPLITLVMLLVAFTDNLPWPFSLACTAAHSAIYMLLDEKNCRSLPSAVRIVAQCVAPILPHLILLKRFHPSTQLAPQRDIPHPSYADKVKLPGGRVDWDAYPTPDARQAAHLRVIGSGEQLACFALCWLPTFWTLLIAIADNWSLPYTKQEEKRTANRLRSR